MSKAEKVKNRVNDFMAIRKRLSDRIEELEGWIRNAEPVMSRAFCIAIQENRRDEIDGCGGILDSCPVDELGGDRYASPKRGWISVEDRLPEWGAPVLVYAAVSGSSWGPVMTIAELVQIDKNGHGWDFRDGNDLQYGMTHWRELPLPPKHEVGEGGTVLTTRTGSGVGSAGCIISGGSMGHG